MRNRDKKNVVAGFTTLVFLSPSITSVIHITPAMKPQSLTAFVNMTIRSMEINPLCTNRIGQCGFERLFVGGAGGHDSLFGRITLMLSAIADAPPLSSTQRPLKWTPSYCIQLPTEISVVLAMFVAPVRL